MGQVASILLGFEQINSLDCSRFVWNSYVMQITAILFLYHNQFYDFMSESAYKLVRLVIYIG